MCIKHYALAVLVILIISCAPPWDSNESGGQIEVITISNGSILEAGAPLPVTVVYNESEYGFDFLKITLFDDAGTEIAVNRIERNSLRSNRKREVVLPENLEKGLYHVRFDFFSRDRVVFSTITNFFNETGSFRLNNIQSYPPNPVPGERVIFIADFTADNPSANPYFRWIMGRNIVFAGYHSQGANKYSWTTPSAEGVYSITVELFPFRPSDRVFQRFSSAISNVSSVIVSESNRMNMGRFLPKTSYSMLFHFRGEISDSGFMAGNNGNLRVVGRPSPDFRGGVFGYSFRQNEYIEIPSIVIPFSREGVMQPFSAKFRFINDYSSSLDAVSSQDRSFFNSFSNDGSFRISIGQDNRAQYFSEIVSGSHVFRSHAFRSRESASSMLNLTVSFYPDTNATTIVWKMNGQTVERKEIPFVPRLAANSGKTTVGSGLFPVLFDEAGVFARTADGQNSVSPFCFRDYNAELFGRALLFAEGFDYVRDLSPLRKEGAEVNNGQAALLPDGWIRAGTGVRLFGNMEVNITGDCTIVIRNSAGADVFSRDVTGGSGNFIINNMVSGDYDIYIVNNSPRTTFVDSMLITRVH